MCHKYISNNPQYTVLKRTKKAKMRTPICVLDYFLANWHHIVIDYIPISIQYIFCWIDFHLLDSYVDRNKRCRVLNIDQMGVSFDHFPRLPYTHQLRQIHLRGQRLQTRGVCDAQRPSPTRPGLDQEDFCLMKSNKEVHNYIIYEVDKLTGVFAIHC